jgi:cytochrome c biogenesis factor
VDSILILRVLKSVKTALYLMGISMIVFLAGSVYIPKNLAVFSEINDMPLFQWLYDNREHAGKTYWIYAQLLLMAVFSLNMLVCTVYGLIDKNNLGNLVRKLSPHIIHTGVLLVLFGHLVSAGYGFKIDIPINAGERVSVERLTVNLKRVDLVSIQGENQQRWLLSLNVIQDGREIESVVEPAKPIFLGGIGIFAKSADEDGRAILGIVRDPGVRWEIAGAILFMIGAMGIFLSKYSKL